MQQQRHWGGLVVLVRFSLVVVVACFVLSQISFPKFVCRVQESADFVSFVDVDKNDPTVKALSCKDEVVGIPECVPEEYLLPQWDVMVYRDPDFVNP